MTGALTGCKEPDRMDGQAMTKPEGKAAPEHFGATVYENASKTREGKLKQMMTEILRDLEQLAPGAALRVPLAELPDTQENIRSAVHRATRQRGLEVATSADADSLYLWKTDADQN